MINFTPEDLQRLGEFCIFANTPGYILSRFGLDPAVQNLVNALANGGSSPDILIRELNKLPFPPKSLDQLAEAYALLVALCLFNPTKAKKSLSGISFFQNIKWWEEILNISWLQQSKPTTNTYWPKINGNEMIQIEKKLNGDLNIHYQNY